MENLSRQITDARPTFGAGNAITPDSFSDTWATNYDTDTFSFHIANLEILQPWKEAHGGYKAPINSCQDIPYDLTLAGVRDSDIEDSASSTRLSYAGANLTAKNQHLELATETVPDNSLVFSKSHDTHSTSRMDAYETSERFIFLEDGEPTSACPDYSSSRVFSAENSDHGGALDVEEPSEDMEKPYAQLIWQALMSSPSHSLQLTEIYEWIERETEKVKEKAGSGWRNSVRHNLSMNKAFEKTTPEFKGKKSGKSAWRLRPEFVLTGPESTTRYRRKEAGFKRSRRSSNPAPQRQASGAKGGQAARKAASHRRYARQREAQMDKLRMFQSRMVDVDSEYGGMISYLNPWYSRNTNLAVEPQTIHPICYSSPFSASSGLPSGVSQQFQALRSDAILYSPHQPTKGMASTLAVRENIGTYLSGPSVSQAPPISARPVVLQPYVFAIQDGEDASLPTSGTQSPISASDLSFPRTPPTVNAISDMSAELFPGINLDHGTFDCLI